MVESTEGTGEEWSITVEATLSVGVVDRLEEVLIEHLHRADGVGRVLEKLLGDALVEEALENGAVDKVDVVDGAGAHSHLQQVVLRLEALHVLEANGDATVVLIRRHRRLAPVGEDANVVVAGAQRRPTGTAVRQAVHLHVVRWAVLVRHGHLGRLHGSSGLMVTLAAPNHDLLRW